MRATPRAAWLAGWLWAAACADDGSASDDGSGDGSNGAAGSSADTTAAATGTAGDDDDDDATDATDDDDDDDDDETGGTSSGKPVAFGNFCEPCHGPQGQGTPFGYELRHPPREHATWVVRNGREGLEFRMSSMAAFEPSVVDDDTLTAIFDWLDEQPQPRTAADLYLDYCGNCHGEDGAGGSVGRDIRGLEAKTVTAAARAGFAPDMLGVRERYMPAFDDTVLTDDELTAIAEHVGGL